MNSLYGIAVACCFGLPRTWALKTTVMADQNCQGYLGVLNDTDLAGRELAEKPGKLEECCTFCDATPSCGGWSWYDGTCYLKTDLKGTYANKGRVTAEKLLPRGNCTSFSPILADIDLAGTLISTAFAPTMDLCCSQCMRSVGCKGFSYFDQMCYLKGSLMGTYSSPGRKTQCIHECPSPLVVAEQSCQGYQGMLKDTDLSGSELAEKPGKVEECCTFCDTTPSCGGWSWYDDTCYLKTDLKGTYANKGRVAAEKLMPGGNCPSFSPILADIDLAGTLISTAFAPTMDLCCRVCMSSVGCEGFSYFDQMCYLKGNLSGTYSSPGRKTQCVHGCPSPQVAAEQSCQGYHGMLNDTDLSGSDLAEKPGKLEECCTFCDATPSCGGWSWYDGTCYLKTDLKGTYANKGRVTAEKLLPGGNCTSFSPILADIDLAGTLISTVFAPTMDQCCSKCMESVGCKGFSYFDQMCYLKGSLIGTYSSPGRKTQCIHECPSPAGHLV